MLSVMCKYRELIVGVSELEVGVVHGVADHGAAAAQFSRAAIFVVFVLQSAVPQHHRDVRKRPLTGERNNQRVLNDV